MLSLVIGAFWLFHSHSGMYEIREYRGFVGPVYQVRFSPDRGRVVAVSLDGIWWWDRSNGKLLQDFPISSGKVAFNSRLDKALISAGSKLVEYWNLTTKMRIQSWEDFDGGVGALLLLDDKQFLVATGYNKVKGEPGRAEGTYDIALLSLDPGHQEMSLSGHTAAATSLCLVPGHQQVLSAGDDGTLRLWDLQTRRELRSAGTPTGPRTTEWNGRTIIVPYSDVHDRPRVSSVSPDGKIAIWNSVLWDVRNWQEIQPLVSPHPQEKVLCSAFSPDGRRFITGHVDGTVRLWSASSYGEICRVYGHVNYAPTLAVAFSPDGEYALTGGEGTIPGFNAMASGLKANDLVVRLWKLPDSN